MAGGQTVDLSGDYSEGVEIRGFEPYGGKQGGQVREKRRKPLLPFRRLPKPAFDIIFGAFVFGGSEQAFAWTSFDQFTL